MKAEPYELMEKVRREQPLVHHLTNWVTIFDCAQIVKALGGSPVMAHAEEEVEEMSALASALVLNIGTLTVEFIEAMKRAAGSARKNGIPIILDVCGAGATRLRDEKCFELLDSGRIDIIKGNVSEIARLSGARVQTRGVDAAPVAGDMESSARQLARERGAVVVVTGQTDLVTDGKRLFRVHNGHARMTTVVGTGCMATSVIGAFAAVEKDRSLAAASALCCYGIAGELAADKSSGPASFKQALIDGVYSLDRETVRSRARLEEFA